MKKQQEIVSYNTPIREQQANKRNNLNRQQKTTETIKRIIQIKQHHSKKTK
jgi:hypothetical protein